MTARFFITLACLAFFSVRALPAAAVEKGLSLTTQVITITKGFPTTKKLYLADASVTLSATASTGLPVTIETNTPAICTTSGMSVRFIASGNCVITFRQAGDANTLETTTTASAFIFDGGIAYSGLVAGASDTVTSSFLRLQNTTTTAGTAQVTVNDSVTGETLGQWISPSIAGNSEQQFYIGEIEASLTRRAASYTMGMHADFVGNFQTIYYRGPDGAITNGTVCAQGVQTESTRVIGVNSSLVSGYPSIVLINNTSAIDQTVNLTVTDARNGKVLGVYTPPAVAPHTHLRVSAGAMEGLIGKPTAGMYHYIVATQPEFPGYLQHIVANQSAGIETDITASCALDGAVAATSATAARFGGVSASIDTAARSTLNILNQGSYAGTATVTAWDEASGKALGQWTSPSIAGGAGRAFSISEIESGLTLGSSRSPTYALTLQSNMYATAVQHVSARAADGAVTSQSMCGPNTVSDPLRVYGVRSSLFSAVYPTPSAVVVTNKGSAAQTVALGIYDMRSGYRLGTYTTSAIPPRGQLTLSASALETGAHITPVAGDLYSIKVDGTFTGFLQHVVYNQNARIMSDASTYCGVLQTVPTTQFTVTTSKVGSGGGTISISPSTGPFDFNKTVNLTVAADTDSTFLGWAGDCPAVRSCEVNITQNFNAIAVFGSNTNGYTHYVLNMSATVTDGIGGTVTATAGDVNCTLRGTVVSGTSSVVRSGTCSAAVTKDTQVTISATAARGSKFVGWNGYDCNTFGGTSAPTTCTFAMTQNRAPVAVFAAAD